MAYLLRPHLPSNLKLGLDGNRVLASYLITQEGMLLGLRLNKFLAELWVLLRAEIGI